MTATTASKESFCGVSAFPLDAPRQGLVGGHQPVIFFWCLLNCRQHRRGQLPHLIQAARTPSGCTWNMTPPATCNPLKRPEIACISVCFAAQEARAQPTGAKTHGIRVSSRASISSRSVVDQSPARAVIPSLSSRMIRPRCSRTRPRSAKSPSTLVTVSLEVPTRAASCPWVRLT